MNLSYRFGRKNQSIKENENTKNMWEKTKSSMKII